MEKNKNKANIVPPQASKQKSVQKKTYVKPELKLNSLPLLVTSGQFVGSYEP
jgi:hypothetical protein